MTETQTQTPASTALARRSAAGVSLGIPIANLDQAMELSKVLAHSSIIPDDLRGRPGNILAIVLYGQDLGLSPMQAMQAIYVVKGKPLLAAQTWMALARQRGHRIRVLEHTPEICTVEITRGDNGETHRETFTMDDARTAKLDTNDNYRKHPKRMLLARAVSNGCRFLCPEIALGFYAEGEDFSTDPDEIEVDRPIEADDVTDAEIVEPEKVAAEVADLAQQFNFSGRQQPAPLVEDVPDGHEDNPLHYDPDEIAEGV